MPKPTPINYGQFGQNFIEYVVTAELIDEALEKAIAAPLPPEERQIGPGNILAATITGQVGKPDVKPLPELLPDVGFLATLKVALDISAKVVGKAAANYKGEVTIPMKLRVRTLAPLTIFLHIDPINAKDLKVKIEAQNFLGEFGKQKVIEEVTTGVAKNFQEKINTDDVLRARHVDILDMVKQATASMGAGQKSGTGKSSGTGGDGKSKETARIIEEGKTCEELTVVPKEAHYWKFTAEDCVIDITAYVKLGEEHPDDTVGLVVDVLDSEEASLFYTIIWADSTQTFVRDSLRGSLPDAGDYFIRVTVQSDGTVPLIYKLKFDKE